MMDINILPRDFKYVSPFQLKFLKSATIKEVCEQYNKYRTQKDNSKMKAIIASSLQVLQILENQGYVYSYFDTATSWLSFAVNDKQNIVEEKIEIKQEEPALTEFDDTYFFKESKMSDSAILRRKLKVANKYMTTIKSALQREIEFDLTIDDVDQLLHTKRCFYTGVLFDETYSLTFDRMDSTKGYVPGNVVACTTQANSLKNELFERSNALFSDISSLKRFVDIVFIGMNQTKDPLHELVIHK